MFLNRQQFCGLFLLTCFSVACGADAPEQAGPVTSQSADFAEAYSKRFQADNNAAQQPDPEPELEFDDFPVAMPEIPVGAHIAQAPTPPLSPLPHLPVPGLDDETHVPNTPGLPNLPNLPGLPSEGEDLHASKPNVPVTHGLPDQSGPVDNLEDFPTFEIECRGEPTACEQFASGPTWIDDCSAQKGCDVQYACQALDASACGQIADAESCIDQGCAWQTPQVAQDANQASHGILYRLFGGLFITRDKEALTGHKSEGFYDSLKHRPPVYIKSKTTPLEPSDLPGVCVVPPELGDTAALCGQQDSAASCDQWAAFCSWKPSVCQGQSYECANFIEEQTCEAQHGCIWASVP